MVFELAEVTGFITPATCLLYGLPLILLLHSLFSPSSLRNLPTEGGPSAPVLSYIGAYNFFYNAKEVLQRGYDRHKGKLFKVALVDRWLVVVTGAKLVDEVQRLPDDKVSFLQAASDFVGFRYIFGEQAHEDPFHVDIIRTHLTRNLAPVFHDVYDEVHAAFSELIPGKDDQWVPIHAMGAIRTIVARASNRVFIGLPLCRNEGYLQSLVDFTVDVAKARKFIAMFPPFLKPLAGKSIASIDNRIKEVTRYLGSVVKDRMDQTAEYGSKWEDKPSDMLQWIVDEVMARGQGVEAVVRVIIIINFAAIHTSSSSFTHALYHLAAMPHFIKPLREEIENVIAEDGWTKTAMGKMWKLDSFMRESQRYNGINTTSVMRKALKPFTLSDGTFIPSGTFLVTPSLATHFDEDNYDDPAVFDPFRFSRLKQEDMSAVKHQFVTTSPEYIAFGLGKHACPGRFFAANELKAMMAYLIMNYDVKLEDEGMRPENVFTTLSIAPNPAARVMFRKRQV